MRPKISSRVREALIAHANLTPAVEVCGLLFGDGHEVTDWMPCINVSPLFQNSFEIDPVALIAAHKAERAGGRRIVGCYHSHPNGALTLSDRDRACAVPGQVWAIIAGGAIAAWLIDANRSSPIAIT